jgi:hypothetical protein
VCAEPSYRRGRGRETDQRCAENERESRESRGFHTSAPSRALGVRGGAPAPLIAARVRIKVCKTRNTRGISCGCARVCVRSTSSDARRARMSELCENVQCMRHVSTSSPDTGWTPLSRLSSGLAGTPVGWSPPSRAVGGSGRSIQVSGPSLVLVQSIACKYDIRP